MVSLALKKINGKLLQGRNAYEYVLSLEVQRSIKAVLIFLV